MLYDAVQAAAGGGQTRERLRPHVRPFAGTRVLDVGAGTGAYVAAVPQPLEYVTLDLDPAKLARLRTKWPALTTIVGDASRLDFPPQSFDNALCTFLAHHLDDAQLRTKRGCGRSVRQSVTSGGLSGESSETPAGGLPSPTRTATVSPAPTARRARAISRRRFASL